MKQFIEAIIRQYDFNFLYVNALVQDLTEEQMTFVPSKGLLNHPAFTIGHLITGCAMTTRTLGGVAAVPEGWVEIFQRKGPNDQTRPETDASKYPLKADLLTEFARQRDLVKASLLAVDEARLNEEVTWRFTKYMPCRLDLVVFMCITHEQTHIGQLAAWRREMGLPAALGTL